MLLAALVAGMLIDYRGPTPRSSVACRITAYRYQLT
eukprot:COSAG03_NODE_17696_length_370_cov_0.575646_1_plen_35_part_10